MANSYRSYSYILSNSLTIGIICLLFLFMGFESNAQTKYRGKILKSKNGNAALGVKLRVPATEDITYTDILGVFVIYDEREDSIQVVVDDKRFEPIEFTVYPEKDALVHVIKRGPRSRPETLPIVFTDSALSQPSKIIVSSSNIEISNPSNAAFMLQHTVPGLTVTRAGNNPNAPFQLFNRGISSATQRNTPHIIIDGMPEMSLERLNIEDIASMSVTKNAMGGAQYGIMGGAGVVEVQTMQFDTAMPVLRYHSSMGVATVQQTVPILDATEYRQFKPQHDQGASTDWIGAITQTGISHRHHLSYATGSVRKGIYASLGYHEEEGILKQSDFKQGNARLNLRGTSKNGKTSYTLASSFTQRDASLSAPYAFREAIQYNPTIPVYDENGNLTVKLGFEFAFPNPVGHILLTKNLARTRDWVGSFHAKKRSSERKSWEYQLSFRRRNLMIGQNSFTSTRLNYTRFDKKHVFGKIQTNRQHVLGNMKIKRYTGIESSVLFEKQSSFSRRPNNFNDINFKMLQDPSSEWDDLDYEETKYPKAMLSAFTGGEAIWNIFNLFGGVRYDLVYIDDAIAGKLFFHAGIASNLKKILDFDWLDDANLTLGFGKTGVLWIDNYGYGPTISNQFAGEYLALKNVHENYINEYKTEIDLQLNCSLFNNQLNILVNVYDNFLYDQNLDFFTMGEIGNKGLETYFSYQTKADKKLYWKSGLGFFTNKSLFYKFSDTNEPISFNNIWLEPYEQVGQFFGNRTDGTIENGRYALILNPDNTTLEEIIGQTKPSFELTFSNELKWKKWDMAIKLRSIVGHNLYNYTRYLLEINGGSENNIVKTKYFNSERTHRESAVLDIFLENAAFLKLDYLSVGFRPPMKKGNIRIYLAGHDLLTLTRYTGIDPEPVYHEYNLAIAGGAEPFESYYRSRQVVFGVQFSL